MVALGVVAERVGDVGCNLIAGGNGASWLADRALRDQKAPMNDSVRVAVQRRAWRNYWRPVFRLSGLRGSCVYRDRSRLWCLIRFLGEQSVEGAGTWRGESIGLH